MAVKNYQVTNYILLVQKLFTQRKPCCTHYAYVDCIMVLWYYIYQKTSQNNTGDNYTGKYYTFPCGSPLRTVYFVTIPFFQLRMK